MELPKLARMITAAGSAVAWIAPVAASAEGLTLWMRDNVKAR
jgi:hypothetical protein